MLEGSGPITNSGEAAVLECLELLRLMAPDFVAAPSRSPLHSWGLPSRVRGSQTRTTRVGSPCPFEPKDGEVILAAVMLGHGPNVLQWLIGAGAPPVRWQAVSDSFGIHRDGKEVLRNPRPLTDRGLGELRCLLTRHQRELGWRATRLIWLENLGMRLVGDFLDVKDTETSKEDSHAPLDLRAVPFDAVWLVGSFLSPRLLI